MAESGGPGSYNLRTESTSISESTSNANQTTNNRITQGGITFGARDDKTWLYVVAAAAVVALMIWKR